MNSSFPRRSPVSCEYRVSAGSGPSRSYPYFVLLSQVLFLAGSAELLPPEVVARARVLPGVAQPDVDDRSVAAEEYARVAAVCSDFLGWEED